MPVAWFAVRREDRPGRRPAGEDPGAVVSRRSRKRANLGRPSLGATSARRLRVEDVESVQRANDALDEWRGVDRQIILAEILPERVESMLQHGGRLRETHPRRGPRAVHPEGL